MKKKETEKKTKMYPAAPPVKMQKGGKMMGGKKSC